MSRKPVAHTRTAVRVPGQPEMLSEKLLPAHAVAIPEDRLREIADPAAARITVSMDLKDNNYGSGFSAFVSVSITCEQTRETMDEAYGLASDMASRMVADAHQLALETFRRSRE